MSYIKKLLYSDNCSICMFFSLSIKIINQKSIFILSHIIILSNYLSINILNKKRACKGSHLILAILFHNGAGIGIRDVVSGKEGFNMSRCCGTIKTFYNTFSIIGNLCNNCVIGNKVIFTIFLIFPRFPIKGLMRIVGDDFFCIGIIFFIHDFFSFVFVFYYVFIVHQNSIFYKSKISY